MDAVRDLVERHLPEGREVGRRDRRGDPARVGVARALAPAAPDRGRRRSTSSRSTTGPARWPTRRCSRRSAGRRTSTAAPSRCGRSRAWSRADGRRHVTGLVGVQTPQAFRAGPLLDAYRARGGRRLHRHGHGRLRRGVHRPAVHGCPAPPPTSRSPSPRTWPSPSGCRADVELELTGGRGAASASTSRRSDSSLTRRPSGGASSSSTSWSARSAGDQVREVVEWPASASQGRDHGGGQHHRGGHREQPGPVDGLAERRRPRAASRCR